MYEEFDEAAKLIANRKILLCCQYVDKLKADIENFLGMEQSRMLAIHPTHLTTDSLRTIIERSIETTMTEYKVLDICCRVKVEKAGSVYDGEYLCYSPFTVRQIKQSLVKETLREIAKILGKNISDNVLNHMETMVESTLQWEFRRIRFQISDDIYRQIRLTIIRRIIEIFETVSGLIVTIVTFIINIFSPVNVNSVEWRRQVAREIYSTLKKENGSIKNCALVDIKNILVKALHNLDVIATNLHSFRGKTIPQDQYKRK